MNCGTDDCESSAETERANRFLARWILGPKAGGIVDGYCRVCQKTRLVHAWWGFCAIVSVAILLGVVLGCGNGADPAVDLDVLADIAAEDVAVVIEESFSVEVALGEAGEGHSFQANVFRVCRFDKEGQLYLGANDVSGAGTRTLNLKLGVNQDTELVEGGMAFPITGISGGEDVLPGEANVFYEFEGVTGPQSAVFVQEGVVTLFSISPCEGTFSAELSQVTDETLSLQNGAFLLVLQEP